MKCSVVVNVLGVYSKDVIQFSKTLKSVCPSAELIHTALFESVDSKMQTERPSQNTPPHHSSNGTDD